MLIVIIGENCVGKSTLAGKIQALLPCTIYAGKDNMLQVFMNDQLSEHYFYKENGQWIEVLK